MNTLHAWIERCGIAHYIVYIVNYIWYEHIAGMNRALRKCSRSVSIVNCIWYEYTATMNWALQSLSLLRIYGNSHRIQAISSHESSAPEVLWIAEAAFEVVSIWQFQDHWTSPNGIRVSSDGPRVSSPAIWGSLGPMSLKAWPEIGHFGSPQ